MNKTTLLVALILLIRQSSIAQKKSPAKEKPAGTTEWKIPLTADRWEFTSQKVDFLEYKSVPALRILERNEEVVVKGLNFSNGTIEYDFEPEDPSFAGIYFRRKDREENEYFYLRIGDAGKPLAIDGIQYAPIVKGVLLWDMLPWYQGPADFRLKQWNHIKLVIAGAQMLVYVNDMQSPALEVPRLEGEYKEGGLAFDGRGYLSNLVVRPGVTEGLPAGPGFDPTHSDPRYGRSWLVSQPVALPKGQEPVMDELPKSDTGWDKMTAERRGLVNLTRSFGKSTSRRMVWLKARLKVEEAQERKVAFGFSDEAWVFVNGRLTFADKNLYGTPIRKEPDGRCSIDNASFNLSLKAGVNELLIGVSNDFYGWGIIARLDKMEGIEWMP